MQTPRRTTAHGRRTLAVSVIAAGSIALSGSAAMVGTALAATAQTRDALPADPDTPASAILDVVAGLTNLPGPVLTALESADLGAAIDGLTDSQLGELLTRLTGVQLGTVLDGSAPGRTLAALITLTSPQLVALLRTSADAVHEGVPYPVNFVLQTVLEIGANALGERKVPVPAQVTSLMAQPPVVAPAAAGAGAPTVMRARIFSVTPARDRRTKVVRAALNAAARERLRARGGTVRVTVATKGSGRGPVASTVRVPGLALIRPDLTLGDRPDGPALVHPSTFAQVS